MNEEKMVAWVWPVFLEKCSGCGRLLPEGLPPGEYLHQPCGTPFVVADERQRARPGDKWDRYFMAMAEHAATLSKDESTKLGCVIVGPDNEVRSTGYNSFPRGINDSLPERQERPLKYRFFEHAERNAIYNAARVGIPLKGCRLYCAWPPCADCARAVIQAGIIEVVVREHTPEDRWVEDMQAADMMLKEARVAVRVMGYEKTVNFKLDEEVFR